ncbi:AAA family ATPase [Prochlorococcus sp. AH-736-F09]|nr:AAA family ATPase [Prochlorococcus sp. AH-736-F09]
MEQQEIFEKDQDKVVVFKSLKDLIESNYKEMESLSLGNTLGGIEVSLYDFDAMTQGLRRGDLIAFAGRPMMGKTSLALQFARNIARLNLQVCFFSFDMSKEELAHRIMAMETGFGINRVRTGRLQLEEWNLINKERESLGKLPIFIDDKKDINIEEIKTKCRSISNSNKKDCLGLIVIDCCQMMEYLNHLDYKTKQEMILKELKILARELNVPIVITLPVSSKVEGRENSRPMLSDIKESEALENYVDIIAMVYREEYYAPETEDRGIAELIITSHRNGPVGTVKMLFEPQFGRYRNLAA